MNERNNLSLLKNIRIVSSAIHTNLVKSPLTITFLKIENFHEFFYQIPTKIVNNSCLTNEKSAKI